MEFLQTIDWVHVGIVGACGFAIFMFFLYNSELNVPLSLLGVAYAALWYWNAQYAIAITVILIAIALIVGLVAWIIENWSMIFVFLGGVLFLGIVAFGIVTVLG